MTASTGELSWAQQLLQKLGITPTETNLNEVSAWEQAESGGVGSYNNPLNTTLPEPGSYGVNYNNGHPVQGYPTVAEGIQADATALTSGVGKYSHYSNILSDLETSAPYSQFASDLGASPWGTSGNLVAHILGTTPGASTANLLNVPIPVPGLGNIANDVGGVAGGVTSDIGNSVVGAIQNAIKPLKKPFENISVRIGLVIFGSLAVLVGIGTMLHTGSSSPQSTPTPTPAPTTPPPQNTSKSVPENKTPPPGKPGGGSQGGIAPKETRSAKELPGSAPTVAEDTGAVAAVA